MPIIAARRAAASAPTSAPMPPTPPEHAQRQRLKPESAGQEEHDHRRSHALEEAVAGARQRERPENGMARQVADPFGGRRRHARSCAFGGRRRLARSDRAERERRYEIGRDIGGDGQRRAERLHEHSAEIGADDVDRRRAGLKRSIGRKQPVAPDEARQVRGRGDVEEGRQQSHTEGDDIQLRHRQPTADPRQSELK
ncbi:MAG: hypothetical protein M3N29_05725 [Chloroflexota bacterium]|nr:hypothetical protein [Chloroflexota bacterium]